jgi:hypothetical protein
VIDIGTTSQKSREKVEVPYAKRYAADQIIIVNGEVQ